MIVKIKSTLILIFILVSVLFAATSIYRHYALDTDPPVISCDTGAVDISVSDSEDVLLAGVTAQDNKDGDITDRIIIGGISKLLTDDTVKVTYLVFDSDDNMGVGFRYARYTDYKKPTFQLEEPLTFNVGDTITLKDKLFASDVIDGDITDTIRVSAQNITASTEGVYTVIVEVLNSRGGTSRLSLPIVVKNRYSKTPEIQLSDYIVYLDKDTNFSPMNYVDTVTVSGEMMPVSGVDWSGNVDMGTPGSYWVTYTYTAQDGSQGTSILVAVVE